MKRFLVLILSLSILSTSALAKTEETSNFVKGFIIEEKEEKFEKANIKFKNSNFDESFPSVIYKGNAFISIITLAEITNSSLVWQKENNAVSLINGDKEILFTPKSSTFFINGAEKNLESSYSPFKITNEKSQTMSTMVPLRFSLEEIGYNLSANDQENFYNITDSKPTTLNLSNILLKEKENGTETLQIKLDGISSPSVIESKNLVTITVPNSDINIEGHSKFNLNPKVYPFNFISADNHNGTSIIKVELSNKMNLVKYFDGNNFYIDFKLPNQIVYSDYNISFDEMVNLQYKTRDRSMTDKYRSSPVYVNKNDIELAELKEQPKPQVENNTEDPLPKEDASESIGADVQTAEAEIPPEVVEPKKDETKGTISSNNVNLHSQPNTLSETYGTIAKGKKVDIKNGLDSFYEIIYDLDWRWASKNDIHNSLSIPTFKIGTLESFQFLDLSKPADLDKETINSKILKEKGILTGKGDAFIKASKKNKINEIYLISHAILETGGGTSELSKGVVVSSVNGVPVEPKKVYNMFGIGAIDSSPLKGGSEMAYNEGWDTPEKAIIGGAKFISEEYVNRPNNNQNTIYEMKWNPDQLTENQWHQYATDIDWANKQVENIKKYYDMVDNYKLYYDIPRYKK